MSQHISEKFPLHIIAIGASAGGLEALQEFLAHLPDLDDSCILIAQHLSPTHKSMLVQLLSRQTTLRVSEAIHGHNLSAKTVYITPPDKEIYVQGDQIFLRKPSQSVGPKPSVDVLFNSLAHQENRLVLGIILSGTGSDGAAGVLSLKNSGGIILVQDPNTAKYDGMPQSAIQTGMVDLILPPEKMGQEIEYIFQNSGKIRPNKEDSESDKGLVLEADAMARIFSLMGKRTGTDFSNYKSATISRRLEKRLNHLNIPTIEEYLKYIEKEPREIDEMFATILIGVTKFFRDEEAFSSLKESLIQLVDGLADENPYLRIWVAGCSTGEEAYTIAIIIFQILQENKMRVNVQIFATDIDDKAIAFARRGIYSSSSLSHLPDSIQDQFFIKRGKDYELVKTIRSMVLFSKHDLIKNPPFLKLDLISCRNLLIYFNSILQEHVFPIFHYALKKDAILLLGKSETIGKFTDLFTTYDAKNKIFLRKRAGNIHPVKFSSLSQTRRLVSDNTKSTENISMKHTIPEMVKETFYNTFEYPYVVIDDEYNIQEVNGDVRLFLSLVPGAIQVNILKMVNPELQIEVRSLLARVIRERLSLKSNIKKFELFGNMHYVRISAKPLLYSNSIRELFVVVFEKLEISEFINKGNFTDEDSIVNARILELEHELTSTKEHLQTYIEEIETTNEELQSLNEEMQSTNEELQSSNEELETTNEELQSTNEEIQIAYAELKAAHEEMERKDRIIVENQANIQALLDNDQQAFVLVDNSYKVVTFNHKSISLFYQFQNRDLRKGDSIIDFLPSGQVEAFIQEFSRAIKGESVNVERILEDSQGNKFHYIINYTPVTMDSQGVQKVSLALLDVSELKKAISEISFKDRIIQSVFNAMSTGICITDSKGYYYDVNDKYCELYGFTKDELIGKHFTMIVPEESKKLLSDMHDKFIDDGIEIPFEVNVQRKDGKIIQISALADLLVHSDTNRFKVTSVMDITEQKSNKTRLIKQNTSFKEIAWIQSHEVRKSVSQILGLIQLYHENLVDEKEKNTLLDNIYTAANELDQVIKNINIRLEENEGDFQ